MFKIFIIVWFSVCVMLSIIFLSKFAFLYAIQLSCIFIFVIGGLVHHSQERERKG